MLTEKAQLNVTILHLKTTKIVKEAYFNSLQMSWHDPSSETSNEFFTKLRNKKNHNSV